MEVTFFTGFPPWPTAIHGQVVDVANATAGSAEALFPSWKAVPDFPRVDVFPGQVYQKKTRRFLDSSLHLV